MDKPAIGGPAGERRIGSYQILQELGRGGMGVVFKARQIGLDRTVALKCVLAGPLASPEFVRRFRGEAEAVARLRHPNIVAIHEVGEHDGQLYFSMDYIEGESLGQRLQAGPLDPGEAARLARSVADAIQYAHERGVLHRDIKPANILVDADGSPHVTDFGLAKRFDSLSGETSPAESVTVTGQVLGSPNFMAPEQIRGPRDRIGPWTDVHGIGATLYQMLTGRPPYVGETLAGTLDQVATADPVPPKHLRPGIPEDLDVICLRCLEKRPSDRFSTAAELASELGRWLRHEPILSRPATVSERMVKWYRRKPMVAGLATAVVALLVLGGLASLWEAIRATRAEREAVRQAAKSEQMVKFLEEMLQGAKPSVAMGRDTTILREIVDKARKQLESDSKVEPDVAARLMYTIGRIYEEIGDRDAANALLEESLNRRRRMFPGDHAEVAESMLALADLRRMQSRHDEATKLGKEALEMNRRLFGNGSIPVATALNNLAGVLEEQSRYREAIALYREALKIRRERLGEDHPSVAHTMDWLGIALENMGELKEAEELHRRALELRRKLFGTRHPDYSASLINLGVVLGYQAKNAEAEALYREALVVERAIRGSGHPDSATVLHNLAGVQKEQGKLREAEATYRECLESERRLLSPTHIDLARTESNFGALLLDLGRPEEAVAQVEEALRIMRMNFKGSNQDAAIACAYLALGLHALGRFDQAEATNRIAIAMFREIYGKDHGNVAEALSNHGWVQADAGKLLEAESTLLEALRIRKSASGGGGFDTGWAAADLAEVQLQLEKYTAAESGAREALSIMRSAGSAPFHVLQAKVCLATAWLKQSKNAEAGELLKEVFADLGRHRQELTMPNRKHLAGQLRRLQRASERGPASGFSAPLAAAIQEMETPFD